MKKTGLICFAVCIVTAGAATTTCTQANCGPAFDFRAELPGRPSAGELAHAAFSS